MGSQRGSQDLGQDGKHPSAQRPHQTTRAELTATVQQQQRPKASGSDRQQRIVGP
jgi:hypothetical protein